MKETISDNTKHTIRRILVILMVFVLITCIYTVKIDASETLAINYKDGYPILLPDDAKVFLAFIYNKSDIMKKDLSQNEYYKLMTGDFSSCKTSDELDLKITAFSSFVRESMKTQADESVAAVDVLSDKLTAYLEKKMNSIPNLDEEINK